MPATLRFEATRKDSGKIALSGSVPSKAAVAVLGKAAGGAPTKGLAVATDLPDTFVADATSGLSALAQLPEGHLGFDGTHWWLQGRADLASARDGITATIAALPDGGQWSVSIDLMQPLDACRSRVLALQNKNVIQFTGRDTFVKTAQPALDELAADLKICPNTDVHVQGHTDNDGAASANLGVSVARAEAVIEALVQRGLDDGRFYAEGFGETDPIASNDSKAGKAANRRITFQIDTR
jgi:outer membrane protein OmpA-like peptidoglycan-associated protein